MTRSAHAVELGLWLTAAAMAVLAGIGWRNATADATTQPAPVLRAPAGIGQIAADALDAASTAIVDRDPFRLDRRPPSVPYSPELEGAPLPPVAAAPPKPALVLKGTVGGPPWQAVLEGVPGREGGVLVRKGDTLGALRVRTVGRDTVIVQGMDTTWRLTVRRVWQ